MQRVNIFYLEIYNGTGRTIDLRDYWIAQLNFGKKEGLEVTEENIMDKFLHPENYNTTGWTNNNYCTRIGDGEVYVMSGSSVSTLTSGSNAGWPEGPFMLPHRSTVVIVPQNSGDAFKKALLGNDCRVIGVASSPMAVSGDDPQILLYLENSSGKHGKDLKDAGCEWIDMAGMAGTRKAEYIMYRLESTLEVPRRYPKIVDMDEWDYRAWTGDDKVEPNAWSNLLSTAGAYDKNIGLGGNMEFRELKTTNLPWPFS